MLKKLLTLVATWGLSFMAFAQTDTMFVTQTQDTGTLQPQRFIDRFDYVFGTRQPTRWMLKLNVNPSGVDPQLPLNTIQLSGEIKLTPGVSIQGGYEIGVQSNAFSDMLISTNPSIEMRWYFDMARRIREGRSANNLSGNYFGLALSHRESSNIENYLFFTPYIAFNNTAILLRYGVQRRWFRWGYFDFNYGIGVRSGYGVLNNPFHLFSSTQVAVGLALAKPRSQALPSAAGQCEVLRCFQEDRRMFKIDLYNLLRINDFSNLSGSLNTAYEQKIGNSAFSVEVQGIFDWRYQQINFSTYPSRSLGYGYTVSVNPRYYYSLNRRMAKGRSGNNLSGAYFVVKTDVNYAEERVELKERDQYGRRYSRSIGSGPGWGIQHRLFRHGFVDLNFGLQYRITRKNGTALLSLPFYDSGFESGFTPWGALRIGLAF